VSDPKYHFAGGFSFICVASLMLVACGERGTEGLTATVTPHVHPVLIRNEHNVILQMVIDSKRKHPARLQSVEFALDGTDDVNDLESLELYQTGAKPEFAPDAAFGERVQPAAKISFRGDQLLQPGANIFWLSCRLKPSADLSHKVGAAVSSVGTAGGALKPGSSPAAAPKRIGIALRKHKDDGVDTYRIPSLATGAKGTLYSVYDMRRRKSRDLQEDIDIGLSRSTDGGRTWEPVRVIMDMGEYGNLPPEQNGVSDPGIVVDQKTGEIFVFAVWMWGKPGKHQWNGDGSEPGFEIGKSAQLMMVRSKDDGLTWTKPDNLTRKLKKAEWWLLAPSPQQGINLADGTLVLPAQGRDEKGVPFATLMVSRDHGASWTVGAPAFSGGNECQAAQLGDGSIMLNMRNDHERYRAVYVTTDLGKTWRPHETNRNTLIEPNCNASLRRVDFMQGGEPRHVLLFANPQSQTGRIRQTIQVSFDDGRTWPKKNNLLLDEGKGRGYPSLSRVDDEHVGIVYEGSQADVVFEKISLHELLR
jgi:sialidase-1